MDRSLSVIIKNSSFLREKSDYDDFFIAGKKEAEKQIEDAEYSWRQWKSGWKHKLK